MTFGFIGTGNMASALVKVICDSVDSSEVALSNRTVEKAQKLARQYGCTVSSNKEIAKDAKFIILGVKPQMMDNVLDEIAPILKSRTANDYIIVSMAAGLPMSYYTGKLDGGTPIIRIMPNTPVSVRQGIILHTSKNTETEDLEEFLNAFKTCGMLMRIDEGHFDIAGTISGCGPAFADMFIQALADGGVRCGLDRSTSTKLASQMLMGSAKLVLETGRNPIELRDQVTSPGGTTIEGVLTLEEHAVPYAISKAVINCYEKNSRLK